MTQLSESDRELLAEGERLILAAFAAARAKDVPDWRRMTSAVLKNRLLEFTHREFNEQRWNVISFRQFLAQYPDLLTIDASRHPPVVELIRGLEREVPASETGQPEAEITARHRVRPDLWHAVLDYSSGRSYVWDTEDQAAVPVAAPDADPRPRLPSVDESIYASWRDKFAREQSPIVPDRQAEDIERWRSEGLATRQLPVAIRGLWNAELKRRVIDTLKSWFEANQIAVPENLVESQQQTTRSSSASTERLRDVVLACVAAMTREELEALSLPPAAVLRMRR